MRVHGKVQAKVGVRVVVRIRMRWLGVEEVQGVG